MNAVNKNMRVKDDEQTLLTDTGNNVSDKEEAEDMIDDMKKDWLVPMTVRFSREANEVFQELADLISERTSYTSYFKAVSQTVVNKNITRKGKYLRFIL